MNKIILYLKKSAEAFSLFGGHFFFLLSAFADAHIFMLLPPKKRCSTHVPGKQPHPVWKTWIKNWSLHEFSFLFFLLGVSFPKSRKYQLKSENLDSMLKSEKKILEKPEGLAAMMYACMCLNTSTGLHLHVSVCY